MQHGNRWSRRLRRMRNLIPVRKVAAQKSHTEQQGRQRRRALDIPNPAIKICPQLSQKSMWRNRIERIIQSHSRLRQQIRGRLQHRQRPQALVEPLERLHLTPAIFTSQQVLLQNSGQLIWKLAVIQQHNTISCVLTLHCPTSTSLKFLLTPGVSSSPLFPFFTNQGVLHLLSSDRFARNFRVARNNVFLAVSSVVLNISPIVLSFRP